MYKEKIVKGDIFEKSDGSYVIITNSKEEELAGKKFTFNEPRGFHYNQEEIIERKNLVEKYGHISLRR